MGAEVLLLIAAAFMAGAALRPTISRTWYSIKAAYWQRRVTASCRQVKKIADASGVLRSGQGLSDDELKQFVGSMTQTETGAALWRQGSYATNKLELAQEARKRWSNLGE